MGLCTVAGSYGELCLSGLTTSLCLLCLSSALLTRCSVSPCTTCVHISVTLPRWLMLPVLLQDLLDTLVLLQPQCSVKAGMTWGQGAERGSRCAQRGSQKWWTMRPPISWCQVMGSLNMVLLQEVCVCAECACGVV